MELSCLFHLPDALPLGKVSNYALRRRVWEARSRSGRFGENLLHLQEINPDCSVIQLTVFS